MRLCECGCGQPTALATKTRTARGQVKGQPARFLPGHSGRPQATCKRGHDLTQPENVYVEADGHRRCRLCKQRMKPRTPTRETWRAMVARCTNPNHANYAYYGGRGIRITPHWLGPGGFEAFVADMGERPEGTTLDRIDPDGNYEPGNCRWATPKEQRANQRRK